jgi:hypothetical protein
MQMNVLHLGDIVCLNSGSPELLILGVTLKR